MSANATGGGDHLSENENPTREIEEAASRWAARRARGLSSEEGLAFAEWIQRDRRHAPTITRLEATWSKLDQLRVLAPAGGNVVSDPDFFRSRPRWARRHFVLSLASAAAIVLCLTLWRHPHSAAIRPAGTLVNGTRHLDLPDGSGVDLRGDAAVAVDFSASERRVRLVTGEANFTVAKNPARPFLVLAQGVIVRAVGTVFSVRLDSRGVDIAVSDGKVRIGSDRAEADVEREARYLVAGEHLLLAPAVRPVADSIPHTDGTAVPSITGQGEELVFVGQPLATVVEQFNLHARRKLVIIDPEIGAVRVGGRFRSDNAEGFVRLLENGFGVSAEQRSDEIVLRRRE